MQGIYCIEHKDSGKKYIGSSINIESRLSDHLMKLNTPKDRKIRHHNAHLKHAWDKYGEESFIYYILEEMPEASLDALRDREREIIESLWGSGKLYNTTKNTKLPIDDPNVQRIRSEAHAQYFSKSENIIKASETSKQRWKDPDFAKRISDSMKAKYVAEPERLLEMSENTKRQWENLEFRKLKSDSLKEKWKDPAFRESQQIHWTKRINSEAFIKARAAGVSKSMLSRWTTDEFRNKMLEGSKTWSNKPVRRLDTGEEFTSGRIASLSLGLNKAAVSVALGRGTRCAGTYWEYVTTLDKPKIIVL